MAEMNLSVRCIASLIATLVTQASAQPATEVAAGPLSELVRGRTLAISFYGDPSDPKVTYVWDFKPDGVLCARIIGAKRTEKCAEEGKWNLDGAALCWELPSIGKSLGINPACSTVLQTKPDRYELRNKKTPDLKFASVMSLR
jgi:hypothetical protein